MSNNNSSSGIGGLLGIVACIAAFFVARKFFPSLGKLLLIAGIVLVVLIMAIVIIVIACSKSTAKDKKKTGLSDEASAVLSKGRTQLMDLRRNGMCIKNQQIRTESEVICKSVDKILRTLREQPEDIPEARQFFNYYLPTFGKIISKYLMLERSGISAQNVTESTISCLADIKTALEKQHANFFEDDMLDLSVEMEALKVNCKRDGLLADEDFNTSEETIPLTL